jgi:hypothetical protein
MAWSTWEGTRRAGVSATFAGDTLGGSGTLRSYDGRFCDWGLTRDRKAHGTIGASPAVTGTAGLAAAPGALGAGEHVFDPFGCEPVRKERMHRFSFLSSECCHGWAQWWRSLLGWDRLAAVAPTGLAVRSADAASTKAAVQRHVRRPVLLGPPACDVVDIDEVPLPVV